MVRSLARIAAVTLIAGCIGPRDYQAASDAASDDGDTIDGDTIDGDTIDGVSIDGLPALADIIHVRAIDETIGTGDLTVTDALAITTSGTPGASISLPAGVSLAVVPQDGDDREVVLLRVRTFTVGPAGVVRATGTRPLAILAESVVLSGWIDVSAIGGTAGAGALLAGAGAGSPGEHLGTYTDAGGGGGSFGGSGADGGDAQCNSECNPNMIARGGVPGISYGAANLAALEGGSPGGRSYFPPGSTACTMGSPGAGGGAIQVFARDSILVSSSGGITAGGGGGDGGDQCNDPYNWLAGHGGGAGGAIYLQADTVQSAGLLLANGGGGGAGAGANGDGGDGSNAGLSPSPAAGGANSGTYSARGGAGATQNSSPRAGDNGPDQGNGGGGGGGLGRIHVRSHAPPSLGTTSPTATLSTY